MPLDVLQPAGFALPEFLKRAIVWPRSGDGSFVSMHIAWKRDGKTTYPGTPCLNEAEVGRFLARNASKHDVYVCMSTQTKRRAGKDWRTDRSTEHAALLRSLYLDVDVKPDTYPTEAHAIADMQRVLGAIGLPPPTFVIATGSGGRHLHWVLSEVIQPDRWQKLADSLANACEKYGAKLDFNVGVDCSRILRVPGTFNWKTGQPRPVLQDNSSSLQDCNTVAMEMILHPYYGTGRAHARGPRRAKTVERPAAFVGATLDPAFRNSKVIPTGDDRHRPTIEALATGCPTIARALTTGGVGDPEPLWKEMMNVACHVQDGERVAHRLSAGDPRYDKPRAGEPTTSEKFQQQRAANLGWPSCVAIMRTGAVPCRSCPHHTRAGASPFHVMQAAQPAPASNPAAVPTPAVFATAGLVTGGFAVASSSTLLGINGLPAGYIYTAASQVARKGEDNEPPKLICTPTFHGGRLISYDNTDMRLRFETDIGPVRREIEVPMPVLADNKQLFGCLARQTMAITPELNNVRRFMTSWIETLQKDPSNVHAALPAFGWNSEGFIFDGTMFSPAGERPVLAIDPELAALYRATGDRAAWDDAVTMLLSRSNPGLNVMLASALAGPLVPFTAEDGLWVHAISPPGGNKTTANRIAVAFWGAKHSKLGKDDTQYSVQKKMETLRNITVFHDDLQVRSDNAIDVVKFAMMVTSGQGRGRLSQDAKQRPIGHWSTLYSSNGNVSVRDAFAEERKTAAAFTRVFEFAVPPVGAAGVMAMGSAIALVNKVDNHYGHAGRIYAAYLGSHKAEVEKMVVQAINAISTVFSCTSDERFWVCAMAVLLVSAALARHLGLIPYSDADMAAMQGFLAAALQVNRSGMEDVAAEATTGAVSDHVGEYLHQNLGDHGCIVSASSRLPTPFTAGRQPTKMLIEVNRVTNMVWFPLSHFREWLRHHKLSSQAVIDKVIAQGAVVQRRGLFEGSSVLMPKVKLIGIAASNTNFGGLPF